MVEAARPAHRPAGHRTWHALAALEAGKGCIALAAAAFAAAGLRGWPAHVPRVAAVLEHWAQLPPVLLLWGAAGYAALRFVEAAGLWQRRPWARWFGIAGYVAYIPVESWELAHRPSWWMGAVLAINLAVVAVLAAPPLPQRATAASA